MAKLPIDIGRLGGSDEPTASNPLDEIMATALESSRGIELEFHEHASAVSMRHRLYRRRKLLQESGLRSFDKLIMTIEQGGLSLRIILEPEFKIRRL